MELNDVDGTHVCACCGDTHEGPFTFFGQDEPASLEGAPGWARFVGHVGRDFCRVRLDGVDRHFVRGHLLLPRPAQPDEPFGWGVWVEIDAAAYRLMRDTTDDPGRVAQPPARGTLDVELPYPTPARGLPVLVRQRPVGEVPTVMVDESSAHLLAQEQRDGMSEERVAEINHVLLGLDD